jgi:lipoprotein-anchoring transpeptidase ErfK/SrfK
MTRHLEPSGRHRAVVRPRYGRIATLGSSVAVVLIAVLGAVGALPSLADNPPSDDPSLASGDGATGTNADLKASKQPSSTRSSGTGSGPDPQTPDQPDESQSDEPEQSEQAEETEETDQAQGDDLEPVNPKDTTRVDTALPGSSGTGKRVVYSESRQRVWLVTDNEKVRRTYLVSGSAYDNLEPGSFQVYSRDKNAVGIDDSGTMNFFVRFTQGDTGAAIGFHDIPVDAGLPVQTLDQLGIPLSHGCVRQKREDAVALWKFAPIGTTVVVTP